jgi:hypothetical protein
MSTLQQLGVTLGVGVGVLATTLLLFAGAVRLRITHIAPRCEARPRDVIYNPDRPRCDPRQDRGNPFLLGWIFWTLQLSYHTMLQGIPGTGTRNNGLSGQLLRVNLDNIVLLRFHALGLRISAFAMVNYCGLLLPTYFTARCYNNPIDGSDLVANCTDDGSYNLTRYERISLSNVPPLTSAHYWDADNKVVNMRLYLVVICSYIVCWYTCYELQNEWVDLLAMRRVYYLEYDHFKGRREELRATMMNADRQASDHPDSLGHYEDCHNPHLHRREAWIPHPEQRDTPPNIGTRFFHR